MPLETQPPHWLTSQDRETINRQEALADDARQSVVSSINAWRDVLMWELGTPATGVDISWHLYPRCQHGLVVQLRVIAKGTAGGTTTFTVKANGNTVGTVTVTGAGLYTLDVTSVNALVDQFTQFTVDMGAGVGWTGVVVEAIIEPTTEVV